MTHASPRHLLLQWTFQRAGRFATCQLTQDGQLFTLSLVTHKPDSTPIETTFASSVEAIRRHAEVAKALRHSGWEMASYTERAAQLNELNAA